MFMEAVYYGKKVDRFADYYENCNYVARAATASSTSSQSYAPEIVEEVPGNRTPPKIVPH